MRKENCNQLVLSGGVAANKALRKAFKKNAEGITDDANITGLIALTSAFKKGWKWRDDIIRNLNKN